MNVLQLKKLLKEYVGGDLTMLGEIPDDPAMIRAVRSYLPVVEFEPTAPASRALEQAAQTLNGIITPPAPALGLFENPLPPEQTA